ncbi:MAG: hypothetical protein RIB71_11620 [Imperialibacter sp.]|uniref:hypothetical protein n=1 Tax=Imperialibacter sp. TaxID=2038411 RepID=UPI0032EB7B4D
MTKTIIFGARDRSSLYSNKWVLMVAGTLFCAYSAYWLVGYFDSGQGISIFFGVAWLGSGIYYLTTSMLLFQTRYVPRAELDDRLLKLKGSLWGTLTVLSWDEIASITYKTFEINFQLRQGKEFEFEYRSNSETSIELKNLIREFAERKNIQVLGG